MAGDQNRVATKAGISMGRQKLKRYAKLAGLANVLRLPHDLKGKWGADYFKNDHPLTLELACGKGEYTVALGRRFPQRNFIGMDSKGDRLWIGAHAALQEHLSNAAFIRGLIEDLPDFFAPQEVAEIWIPFPEPHPKRAKIKSRLTSSPFLNCYRQVLAGGGRIHFKTDDADLFAYTLKILSGEQSVIHELHEDLHHAVPENDLRTIKTTYERRYLAAGKTIKYACFSFKNV